jgi:hypothetical protein
MLNGIILYRSALGMSIWTSADSGIPIVPKSEIPKSTVVKLFATLQQLPPPSHHKPPTKLHGRLKLIEQNVCHINKHHTWEIYTTTNSAVFRCLHCMISYPSRGFTENNRTRRNKELIATQYNMYIQLNITQ